MNRLLVISIDKIIASFCCSYNNLEKLQTNPVFQIEFKKKMCTGSLIRFCNIEENMKINIDGRVWAHLKDIDE